jgi:hypothetical protein
VIANLWPEPYAGRWGAGTKDVLENRLHDLVCAGALTLAYAQHIEARNWVATYKRYVGTPPPASSNGSGGRRARARAAAAILAHPVAVNPATPPAFPSSPISTCSQIPDSKKPILGCE